MSLRLRLNLDISLFPSLEDFGACPAIRGKRAANGSLVKKQSRPPCGETSADGRNQRVTKGWGFFRPASGAEEAERMD